MNVLHICPGHVVKNLERLVLDPYMAKVEYEGAGIFAQAMNKSLSPGHYKVEFPEHIHSVRFLLHASDRINELIKAKTHTFEIYTTNSFIATRIEFDRVMYQGYKDKEEKEISGMFGKHIGDPEVWNYML